MIVFLSFSMHRIVNFADLEPGKIQFLLLLCLRHKYATLNLNYLTISRFERFSELIIVRVSFSDCRTNSSGIYVVAQRYIVFDVIFTFTKNSAVFRNSFFGLGFLGNITSSMCAESFISRETCSRHFVIRNIKNMKASKKFPISPRIRKKTQYKNLYLIGKMTICIHRN